MLKKVIVLGAGLIGKTIAIDLCKQYDVTCADIQFCRLEKLSPRHLINVIPANFKDTKALALLIKPFDLVICAVPGFMGFQTLQTIIEAKKNVVDISFFPENAFLLDELAKKNNVTAVVDCGIAPGLCNIIAGYHYKRIKMTGYRCFVGGLPVKRNWPFDYKAVFSPADVIEEYTRPVQFIENGTQVTIEALSDVEKIFFQEVGELEAFNTDGLRSLIHTMPDVPNMKEKTLRYPGHAELMKIFRETGLFSKSNIAVNGVEIIPRELTSKLLFQKWELKSGEEDFTIMQVNIEGETEERSYTLLDRYDSNTETTSMARTTGYTCTAVANLVLSGEFSRKGVSPPEYVGYEEKCYYSVINYLKDRTIEIKHQHENKQQPVSA
jgi:saccharopine dehydrogenase-like NADP-dependent oxidoreductase